MEKQRMLMTGLRSPKLSFTHRYQKKLANEITISKTICSRLEVVNGGRHWCWWHYACPPGLLTGVYLWENDCELPACRAVEKAYVSLWCTSWGIFRRDREVLTWLYTALLRTLPSFGKLCTVLVTYDQKWLTQVAAGAEEEQRGDGEWGFCVLGPELQACKLGFLS